MKRLAIRIFLGAAVIGASFFASLKAMDYFWPREGATLSPKLAALPPLPPVTRTSVLIAPVAVSVTAIRDTLEAAAPRDFAGKPENPVSQILSKADIGYTVTRSPLAVSGRPEGLTLTSNLSGAMRITGEIGTQAANLGGAIGGLLNQNLGKSMQNLAGRTFDQRADFKGNVAVTARPALTTNWRLEPNLTGQVSIADGAVQIAGMRLNIASEVKPMLDRTVNEQIAHLQGRLRNDPFLEQTARREWTKICRSIPLGKDMPGLPELWLELRPTRAFAAQPRIDAKAVTLTIGVQAETRITPSATQPNCPFPAKLELVTPPDQGRIGIGVPIDLPFTELNKLLEAQIKGRTFPDNGNSAVVVTVQRASIAAAGDRLLISLLVNAKEKKSWFGFGTQATIHIWGKPTLDRAKQVLSLTDTSLAIESEAAFGLLGAAAKAAIPYLEAALAKNAVIDLKPFATNAREKIAAALTDFRKAADGVSVDAAVTGLRLVGIEFDSRTLRVIAEADGKAQVAVSKLPRL